MIPPHWQSILTKKNLRPQPLSHSGDKWRLVIDSSRFFFSFFQTKPGLGIFCASESNANRAPQDVAGLVNCDTRRWADFFFNWHIVLYFLVLFIPLVSFFSLDKTFPVEDESSPGKPHKDLGCSFWLSVVKPTCNNHHYQSQHKSHGTNQI